MIAVDGLRAAALGAYGNTTFPTPALDQFAAESLLFDWCFADAVELPAIYRSLWQSDDAAARSRSPERGYATTLVTDEPAIAGLRSGRRLSTNCVQLPACEADARRRRFANGARATVRGGERTDRIDATAVRD